MVTIIIIIVSRFVLMHVTPHHNSVPTVNNADKM